MENSKSKRHSQLFLIIALMSAIFIFGGYILTDSQHNLITPAFADKVTEIHTNDKTMNDERTLTEIIPITSQAVFDAYLEMPKGCTVAYTQQMK